ncbi:MAG: manganese efflux pump MntP family protein [Patescibacteria group bacterium]
MSFVEILILAVSLSLDAAVVAVGAGALARIQPLAAFKIALLFSSFHVLMPILGLLLGFGFRDYFSSYGHMVGGGLLLLVGMQMLWESFQKEDIGRERDILRARTLLVLAVATSIDAFVVGVTFNFIPVNVPLAIGMISASAFLMSLIGVYLGRRGKRLLGNRIELVGAAVIILLAAKIIFGV